MKKLFKVVISVLLIVAIFLTLAACGYASNKLVTTNKETVTQKEEEAKKEIVTRKSEEATSCSVKGAENWLKKCHTSNDSKYYYTVSKNVYLAKNQFDYRICLYDKAQFDADLNTRRGTYIDNVKYKNLTNAFAILADDVFLVTYNSTYSSYDISMLTPITMNKSEFCKYYGLNPKLLGINE